MHGVFRSSPVPHFLFTGPEAPGGFKLVFAAFGVPRNPNPRAAKLNFDAGDGDDFCNHLAELLGGLIDDAGAAGGSLGVVPVLQRFKSFVVLGIYLLHGFGVSPKVWVVLNGETAVKLPQLFNGGATREKFHGAVSSLR